MGWDGNPVCPHRLAFRYLTLSLLVFSFILVAVNLFIRLHKVYNICSSCKRNQYSGFIFDHKKLRHDSLNSKSKTFTSLSSLIYFDKKPLWRTETLLCGSRPGWWTDTRRLRERGNWRDWSSCYSTTHRTPISSPPSASVHSVKRWEFTHVLLLWKEEAREWITLKATGMMRERVWQHVRGWHSRVFRVWLKGYIFNNVVISGLHLTSASQNYGGKMVHI